MEIDLICNDGSPIGITPPELYGRGLGGAETAMVSLMETLAKRGHLVRVYNDPRTPGVYDNVQYLPLAEFNDRNKRDILIIFRSPNSRVRPENVSHQNVIWWSTDQYTIGDFRELAGWVKFCVTISPRHMDYHKTTYGIDPKKIGWIDLGVRLQDYPTGIERITNRLIFCSVPDRGLPVLNACWPLLKRQVPTASLVITSDYRLWGNPTPDNQQHRLMWAGQPDVDFKGRVTRAELSVLQEQADLHAYPCTYDELFCLSVAECQVAGALPVTSTYGAIQTTNEWGVQIPGIPTSPEFVTAFVARIANLLTKEKEYLNTRRLTMMPAARLRFDWNRIAERWEYLFQHQRLD